MSQTQHQSAPPAAAGVERWIVVCIASLAVGGIAAFLPEVAKAPVFGAAVVLMVAGLVMLVRQERASTGGTR